MRPVQQAIEQWRRFANNQVASEGRVDVSGRRYACTSTEESSRLRASASQVSALGPESGLNGLDNLYIPTSSLAICFSVLEDSGPSAETCLDTERRACPQPAAFL